MNYLLIIYFCLIADVCDRYTTNSASFYVKSCEREYIRSEIAHVKKNETSSIDIDVVDHECIKLYGN